MSECFWHVEFQSYCDDGRDRFSCLCERKMELYGAKDGLKRNGDLYTTKASVKKRSILKTAFWSRCLIALFLHIGCLAVDHRHRNSELPYEEDELRLILAQSFPSSKLIEEEKVSKSVDSFENGILSFHPISLDFKESPVGMPKLGVVRVDNRLTEENVKLISISGSTVHFHSSFFADKVISPGSNTTFEVVFLSRAEGQVDSHLFIHTSRGLFKYHVRGVGLPNPYRLKPLSAKIPVNGSYEPLITMHNPHGRRIQVVEMLSSGSDFHLSLPDPLGESEEGPWAIEPFQTKPVMKGTFQGKAEGNHTGYIKIRVNSTTTASEYLLVPVEVQVSSSPGIYSPQESLDFGLLVRTDKPKTLSLSLINAQELPINVQSVSVKGDLNNAVKIEFRPITIEPDNTVSTVVALVTFDPSETQTLKDSHGFLEIVSEGGGTVTVPFRATVLHGELEYSSSALGFFIKADNFPSRNFSVRNTFPTTVAIYEVKVSHPDVVQLTSFNKGNGSHFIPPGEKVDLFRIKVGSRGLCDSTSGIQIMLKSNVTNLKLPITCYDGKLEFHALEGTEIKFGSVELYSNSAEYFSVSNSNPVEVRLKSWGSNVTWGHVELVGMQKGSKEDLAKIQDFDSLKKSLFLQPGHMAVFSVVIRHPTIEGLFKGESYVTTDHNQTLRVPFTATVSKGAVHAETIVFDKAFPGKISLEKLQLSSTYNQTLGLRHVWGSPRGVPLWFSPTSTQDIDIAPRRKICVGKIHFDPKQFCRDECYSGFLLDSAMGRNWVRGSEINWETAKLDWNILKQLQQRFERVKDTSLSNMTLWVETSAAKDFKVATTINYAWPRVSSSKVIVFPLTAVGNESIVDVQIQNPTSSPLFVQALLASDYGPYWIQYVKGNGVGGNLTEGETVFTVSGLGSEPSQSDEKTMLLREVQKTIVKDILNLESHKAGTTFLLPPSGKLYLRCRFRPSSKQLASTLLLVRNNLTGIETTWLKARAGTGLLTLGSGIPGSSLLFQITEKLLEGCEKEPASKYLPPQLTVRRSFLARNVGDIPLDISLIEIYPPQGYYWPGSVSLKHGESCEGFGFRILNCSPFTLQPNETHSIDIAYTPDFTMSRMVRSLRLIDSNGVHYNYTLVAMVPSGMLSVCSTIIARPVWEPVLKCIVVGVAFCGFLAASFLAYFEMNSIVSQAIVATVRVLPGQNKDGVVENEDSRIKLDLKAVYDKVDNRFKRSAQELLDQLNVPPTAKTPSSQSAQSQSSVVGQTSSFPPVQQPAAGLRNRKKSSRSITGSFSGWNKGKEDRRASASEDATNNNNINHESKSYVEVTGKRKGLKGGGVKGKAYNVSTAKSSKEEETSSTTTESSNGDDVGTNLISLMSDSLQLASSQPYKTPTNMNREGEEERKKVWKKKSSQKASTPIVPESVTKCGKPTHSVATELNKKNHGKQKQLSGSSSSGSQGSASPIELYSAWDGLSSGIEDLNGFDSKFHQGFRSSPQRPLKSGWADQPLFSTPPPGYMGIGNTSLQPSHSTLMRPQQFSGSNSNHYAPQFQHSHNQRSALTNHLGTTSSRRPGVIGQQRQAGTTQANQFVSGVLTTLSLTMSTTSAVNSRPSSHGMATRTTSWNSDISRSVNAAEDWNCRRGEVYASTSSLPYRSAASPSAKSTSQLPNNVQTELYNGNPSLPSSDILSSLWQMNSFEPISTSTAGYALTESLKTNKMASHGADAANETIDRDFFARIRPDPVRFPHAQNKWPISSSEAVLLATSQLESGAGNGSSGLFGFPYQDQVAQSFGAGVAGGWAISTQPNPGISLIDGSEWQPTRGVPPQQRRLDDLWQDANCTYWPSASGPADQTLSRPTPTSAAAPAPRSEISSTSPGTTGTGTSTGIALQSQREIEVGLGFNPFGSNIWTDHDPEKSGWSASRPSR